MKPRHILLAIFVVTLWGGNFVAAKIALMHFPTFLLLGLRMALAAALMVPFMRKGFRLDKAFQIAFVFTVIHLGSMFGAMRLGLDVSFAIIFDQLRVPFAVILGMFIFNEKIGWRTFAGIAVAIAGTALIAGTPHQGASTLAIIMAMMGGLGWAIYNVQLKQLGQVNALSFIGWISLLGTPQLFLLSWIFEDNQWQVITTATWEPVLAMLFTTIAVTIVAHGSWYYLLTLYPINKVVPYSLLMPFCGILFAVWMLDEHLTWAIMVGGMMTVAGIAIILWRRPAVAEAGDET